MARSPRGKSTITQRIALDGGEQIRKELEALGKAGEEAFRKLKEAVEAGQSPGVKLSNSIRDLQRQFAVLGASGARLRASMVQFGTALVALGRNLTLIGGAAAGAAIAIVGVAKAGADAATQAGEQAQALGLTIDAYGRLSFAAEQSGVSVEQFGTAITRLNVIINKAAQGNEAAAKLFQNLGVAIKDANGNVRSTEAIFQDLAEAFDRLPNGAQKSALAVQFFGRTGAELIPLLNEGREGLRALGKEAEALGIVFTEEQFRIGDALGDALDKLNTARKGITAQLGLLFAEDITRGANAFIALITRNREAIQAFAADLRSRVIPVVEDFVNAIVGNDAQVRNPAILEMRDSVVRFARDVQSAVTGIIIPAFNAIVTAANGVARVFNTIFGTDFSGTSLLVAAAILKVTGALRVLTTGVRVAFNAARLLFDTLRAAPAIFAALRTAMLALGPVLALLATNPFVLAIAGATALAGVLAFLATRQTDAEQAATAHVSAMQQLDQAIALLKAGVPEAAEEVKKLGDEALISAEKLLELAKAELAAAKAVLEATQASLEASATGQLEERLGALEGPTQRLRDALNEVAEAQQNIVDLQAKIAGALEAPFESIAESAEQATEAIKPLSQEVSNLPKVTRHGAEAVEQLSSQIAGLPTVTRHGGEAAKKLAEDVAAIPQATSEAGEGFEALEDNLRQVPSAAPATESIVSGLEDIPAAATSAQTAATTAFTAIQTGAQTTALSVQTSFANLFSPTFWQGFQTGAQTAFAAVQEAAAAASASLGETFAALSAEGLLAGLQQVASEVEAAFASAAAAVIGEFNALVQGAQSAARGIVSAFNGLGTTLRSVFAGIVSAIKSQFAELESAVRSLVSRLEAELARLRAAIAAARAEAGSGGTGGGTLAGGGMVHGPGTATSDSIPAWLSRGEFVVRAKAVQHYGPALLRAINGIRLPRDAFQGFSLGGLVEGLSRSLTVLPKGFAMGGLVPQVASAGAGRTVNVNLSMGGQSFAMLADEVVANKLIRVATGQKMRAAGKTPPWR